MNKQETGKIMQMIKAAYSTFGKDTSQASITMLWAMCFKDIPFETVFEGVMNYINSDNAFPPSPGQIKTIIQSKGAMTPDDGWKEVERALKNSARDSKTEFEKLSPPVKAYVGGPETLKILATTPLNTHYLDRYQEKFLKEFNAVSINSVPDYEALNKPQDLKAIAEQDAASVMNASKDS
jgi:hypothetical protein